MTILVTGGAGFIGSALIRLLLDETGAVVVNLDKLTYAANPLSLAGVAGSPRYAFVRGDVCDADLVAQVLRDHDPDAVIHLAAESHVDRSIDGPAAFVETNVRGSFTLLEAARAHWAALPAARRARFRFVQVSTDEVFGSLGAGGRFDAGSPYRPNSPYSASKAAGDHFARAWHATYGLPTVVTHSSNNYGPRQFPEKLIPVTILNALAGRPLPVYGDGGNVRDWLHVEDHARALLAVLERGRPGETYAIGGDGERGNLDLVRALCRILDDLRPSPEGGYQRLIRFVADRPGHDRRYAIDASHAHTALGWRPRMPLEQGLRATVAWYLANAGWWRPLLARHSPETRLGAVA